MEYNIKDYLPKGIEQRETLTANNIEDGVVVEIRELKPVNTTFGSKLLAVVKLENSDEEYSLFLNKLSIQNIYSKYPDVNKWIGIKLKLSKVQMSIRGKLKQAIIANPL